MDVKRAGRMIHVKLDESEAIDEFHGVRRENEPFASKNQLLYFE